MILLHVHRAVIESAEQSRISIATAWFIVLSPVVILGSYGLALILNTSRDSLALRMLEENQAVELLTFAVLLVGGLYGLFLVRQFHERVRDNLIVAFYALFSLGLIFVAMEEISWGQQFLEFSTPPWLAGINAQDEFTLHNINAFQVYLEAWPLTFGLIGCLGVGLGAFIRFKAISPSFLLLSWFIGIAIMSALDLYIDLYPETHLVPRRLDWLINDLDELIECMVGMSGFLFLWLNRRVPYDHLERF